LIQPSRSGRPGPGVPRLAVGPCPELSAGAAASMSRSANVLEVISGYDPLE